MSLRRRSAILLGAAAVMPLRAQTPGQERWRRIEAEARGQTVYFNAWAGSERTNAYLQWAAGEIERTHGVKLQHVKIADTAEAVQRIRAEKAVGRSDGAIDMVWINGENFLRLKNDGLLFGPFAEQLPSYIWVDTVGKPTTLVDFSERVDGMEAPWGMAQLTFFADRNRLPDPPQSAIELLAWARRNQGRFTYPKPPQFHGTTFLKQVLSELATDRGPLYLPVSTERLAKATPPLWNYLDQLHPNLWRAGKAFAANTNVLRQMMADGELALSLTFNPSEAANQILAKTLPASVFSWQFAAGTIGNTHFLAIPFNARARAGAQVVIDFLLSPRAQARKADIAHWGDPTVLAMDKLSPAQRAWFTAAAAVPGSVERPAPPLPEPHASWVEPIEREWARRYAAA